MKRHLEPKEEGKAIILKLMLKLHPSPCPTPYCKYCCFDCPDIHVCYRLWTLGKLRICKHRGCPTWCSLTNELISGFLGRKGKTRVPSYIQGSVTK